MESLWSNTATKPKEIFRCKGTTEPKSLYTEGYRVPIQSAKNPLEKSLENPLEISYTGKTQKMGSLDMSHNQIWISSGFSSGLLNGFLAYWIGTLIHPRVIQIAEARQDKECTCGSFKAHILTKYLSESTSQETPSYHVWEIYNCNE